MSLSVNLAMIANLTFFHYFKYQGKIQFKSEIYTYVCLLTNIG
jgi:hypothetical protein